MSRKSIVIIGGGIIGLFSAYYLLKKNYKVIILDEGTVPGKQSCSFANAGMLVPSHFTPLASPGAIREGLKSLTGSDSPIGIKWSAKPEFANWMWKFFLASRGNNMDQKSILLAEMNLKSRQLFIDFEIDTAIKTDMQLSGIQMICRSPKTLAVETARADRAHQLGIPCEIWDNTALNIKNPGMDMQVAGAVYYPYDGILDPGLLLSGLVKYLKENDVEIHENLKAEGFRSRNGSIYEIYGEDFQIAADEFVLAAGISMNKLLKTINLSIPLVAGKGLSFTMESTAVSPKYPSLLQDNHIAVTPYRDYVRIASGFSIDNNPNRSYSMSSQSILKDIKKNFGNWPQAATATGNNWVGSRPVTPDGLPLIGKLQQIKNLNIVGGHAMMGLSLAPVSGMLISDIIEGRESDLTKNNLLNPGRFQ